MYVVKTKALISCTEICTADLHPCFRICKNQVSFLFWPVAVHAGYLPNIISTTSAVLNMQTINLLINMLDGNIYFKPCGTREGHQPIHYTFNLRRSQ